MFFLVGPALLDRFGARGAAALAAAAGIIRWSIAWRDHIRFRCSQLSSRYMD